MHDTNARNRLFYDQLWSDTELSRPEGFNTWPLISGLLSVSPGRLEIGPGLRPRLPISGSYFVDISPPAVEKLTMHGGIAAAADSTSLPFKDQTFELVCAFDLLEHADNDRLVLTEVGRVLKDDGTFILSVPLHAGLWTEFDAFVGHVRRYDPDELATLLAEHDLVLQASAVYGMQPASPRLVAFGVWWLTHFRREALWCYNRLLLPLAMAFQKKLEFVDGLVCSVNVDEVILVCRKQVVAPVG